MELKKYRLGDIAEIIGGVSYSPKDICTGGIRILRGGNIQNQHIELKTDDVFLPISYKNNISQIYVGDTILVASTGSVDVLGKAATCFQYTEDVQIGAFLRIIRPKADKYTMLISSALSSDYFKRYIKAQAKGTSINNITLGYLRDFEIYAPHDFTGLSHLSANIENKICLNRAINDNLEAMAKQLYDYWFVQFDFPNEEGKPYKSSGGAMVWNEKLKREIPEEWNVANVFDELSVQYGFPFSTELFTEEPTNIPIVRIRDILENSVSAYSEEEVDEKYKLQKQDLVIGMDGNFHMNYWNDNVSYLNQRSVRLRAKSKSTVSIMQVKYDIEPYIKAKELRAKGSTVGHLSDKDLKELFVLVSPNADFRNKFDSILAEIIENRYEMIALSKQRDELLPLLMNGQATVNSD